MFSAAIHNFVKSVGKGSLIPVPSLDVSDEIQNLQVVIKKNRFWFWQSAKYTPTEFPLSDILTNKENVDVPVDTRNLLKYNRVSKFSANGKFGADLSKEIFGVEIDGDDEITVDAQFGDIAKTEVDLPKLLHQLETRQLDLQHPLVKQVQQNSRKVLAVIVGVAQTVNDGVILHSHSKLDLEADAKAKVDVIGAGAEAKAGIGDDNDKTFTINANTPLAFNMCELLITTSGKIQLQVVEGTHGGFGAKDEVDEGRTRGRLMRTTSTATSTIGSPVSLMFKGLLNLSDEDRSQFRHTVQCIMSTPRLVRPMLHMLKSVYKAITGQIPNKLKKSDLEKLFITKRTEWIDMLNIAGFTFHADDSVLYPDAKTDILLSCRNTFEALTELDDDDIAVLRFLSPTVAIALLILLRSALVREDNLYTDSPEFSSLFTKDSATLGLLLELDFKIEKNHIIPPHENSTHVQAAYTVVYALWGI